MGFRLLPVLVNFLCGRSPFGHVQSRPYLCVIFCTPPPVLRGTNWSPTSSARVADLPEPPLPGPRWLRVRNRQCGICGTDLSLLFVKGSPGLAPAALPANSRLFLGHEVVGNVVEVGERV